MKFVLRFAREVYDHMQSLSAFDQAQILDAIQQQLIEQPNVETRNRKPMRPNPIAPWELRVGRFRVFYDIMMDRSLRWRFSPWVSKSASSFA